MDRRRPSLERRVAVLCEAMSRLLQEREELIRKRTTLGAAPLGNLQQRFQVCDTPLSLLDSLP